MRPWGVTTRYLNFADSGGAAARSYAPDTYERLARIRERVDPGRMFVASHEIR
jgi:hypothetical protein